MLVKASPVSGSAPSVSLRGPAEPPTPVPAKPSVELGPTRDTFTPHNAREVPSWAQWQQIEYGAPVQFAEIPPAKWNFISIVAGDNSLDFAAADDVREMSHVGSAPAGQFNAFALIDRVGVPPQLVWFPSGGGAPRPIETPANSPMGQLLASQQIDTGDPAVARAAISFIQAGRPSSELAVNLWGHGGGWRGVMYDEGSNLDPVSLVDGEFRQAFSGLNISVLSLDACLMQTLELSDLAEQIGIKRVIASQDVEDGSGYDYQKIFTLLAQVPSDRLDENTFGSAMGMAARGTKLTTTSVANLTRMPAMRAALGEFVEVAMSVGGLNNPAIASAYGDVTREGAHENFDLGVFARTLAKSLPPGLLQDKARALDDALTNLVPELYATSNAIGQRGMSLYGPDSGASAEYFNSLELAKTPWARMLRGGTPVPNPLPAWAVALTSAPAPVPAATPAVPGGVPGVPAIELTPDSAPPNTWRANVDGPLTATFYGGGVVGFKGQVPIGYKPFVSSIVADPITRVVTVRLSAWADDTPPTNATDTAEWNVSLAALAPGQWDVEVLNQTLLGKPIASTMMWR